MNFKEEIIKYETLSSSSDYLKIIGKIPVIITAPHTMEQVDKEDNVKLSEPFTKAIALYISNRLNTYALVKINDTGLDSNRDNEDEFKKTLIELIKKNNILLAIDIHGASIKRDFDVELGTVNNLSADFSTIKELQEAFTENGISKVNINDPFKGGAITRSIYGQTDCDSIQIEINGKYRDINNIDELKKICDCLEKFIIQYIETINKSI